MPRQQHNLESNYFNPKSHTSVPEAVYWEPIGALAYSSRTAEEHYKIRQIQYSISQYMINTASSVWLSTVSDTEILRFLRARSGNVDSAWGLLLRHAEWRVGPDGADSISPSEGDFFATCDLNREMYWGGEALDGCPTVIVRTALHVPGLWDNTVYIR